MAYTKTTWKTGDIINADGMNNIETGIEEAHTQVTNISKEIVDLKENGVGGGSGGISNAARTLLTMILNNAVFETDQTSNILALEEALKQSGSSSGNNGGGNGEDSSTKDSVVHSNEILTILGLANTPIQTQNTLIIM